MGGRGSSSATTDNINSSIHGAGGGLYKASSVPHYKESDIRVIRTLNEGNYGRTFQVTVRGHPGLKVLKLPKDCPHEEGGGTCSRVGDDSVTNELSNLLTLQPHRNILQLEGVVTFRGKISLLSSYCRGGSIKDLLYELDLSTDEKFIPIATDVCAGLCHLHDHGVIHRDLACRNLLVKEDGTVVISDYGLSRTIDNSGKGHCQGFQSKVAWAWAAPESLRTGKFTKESDIWSLGVTFWEILMRGEKPYRKFIDLEVKDDALQTHALADSPQHRQQQQQQQQQQESTHADDVKLGRDCPRRLVMDGRLRLDTSHVPCSQAKWLTRLCLKFSPAERPSALELLTLIESRAEGKNRSAEPLRHALASHTRSGSKASNQTPITYDTCPM